MQQFFENVNHTWVMRLFSHMFTQIEANGALVKIAEWNMDMRDESAMGMKRQKSIKRGAGVNAE